MAIAYCLRLSMSPAPEPGGYHQRLKPKTMLTFKRRHAASIPAADVCVEAPHRCTAPTIGVVAVRVPAEDVAEVGERRDVPIGDVTVRLRVREAWNVVAAYVLSYKQGTGKPEPECGPDHECELASWRTGASSHASGLSVSVSVCVRWAGVELGSEQLSRA